MDIKEIKRIVELMKENELSEFEMADKDFRISVKRKIAGGEPQVLLAAAAPQAAAPQVAAASAAAPAAAPAPAPSNLVEIKSPMVGTFYRAGSPEAEPFVALGKEIDDESVVCIVEAMKVMNEIKAEMKGVIRKVLVENATSVEFGQPLFLVEPR
ncbi:MAG: acetyl-CoA carboxylase biotin carboxyl carrier protein [Kiritimatiellae bacterium]|nr:acetyl-CoA carboxylase biotin carboxyl carrier protein [Kiritimatiellia bacterium]MCO5044678.1 acetyl-CoA carboxylase biotin carboxyl carrier protein [Kiritimatiellia bacterium]MCO5060888.1 acetyl-CoA carboxylase biotin carboxyl carrier protein [Kiritimatiellia bacterium]MCO5069425.1 acetyl-CoA carboxylase biotin carboxyl carrier protein [Kiritimatiellia bacterium]MCO6401748.1 acetyl-CoA carboxylase biotin carboxyl carrier protein [Verrucomicrobiota bacterium]